MNRTRLIAALLAMLLLFVLPVCAAANAAADEAAEAVTEAAPAEEPASDNRTMFGVMLLSTVFAAMVVSTLIFKGRDHTKYL